MPENLSGIAVPSPEDQRLQVEAFQLLLELSRLSLDEAVFKLREVLETKYTAGNQQLESFLDILPDLLLTVKLEGELQGIIYNEAKWYSYKMVPASQAVRATEIESLPTVAPYEHLLFSPLTPSKFIELLTSLGLLNEAGQASLSATPGAWAGVIYALRKKGYFKINAAAAAKALREAFGAKIKDRTMQHGLGTNGSEAESFYNKTLETIKELI
ncbi:hypothetical protein [Hymenobacter sp. BT491]|uniref:hypothetical protein n=1 Tax=Hymenobacter sp. BT491 TaxID=2766779 RepID=UPI001653814E|nr:hypothetical protein [Hymenobacter sp. BT491]MBC6992274.1 hypothetical protein [Hymenobacter sp. BT491]